MTLDSLSESSLIQLEEYLSSNPYREYAMQKPYFPKTFLTAPQSHRSLIQQNPSLVAYHELMDNQKDPVALDRLAYKLRMKSDLNIDTLRETHVRRRHRHHHHQHHHHPVHGTQINGNGSDTLSSVPPSVSTKTYGRQPTSITVSTNTMKTLINEDLTGVEGNAVRLGTIDDLIKQFRRAEFRIVRRPAEYPDNASTQLSSDVSTNERATVNRAQYQQERPRKQLQALTEYRFNAPTFPTSPSQTYREPTVHQGLIYQYRTRERLPHNTDLPLLPNRPLITSEHNRQRLNSLVLQDRQQTSVSSKDKRIQESREKCLMKTEKQVCVCNKLTIVDPFNSTGEHADGNFPHLHPTQAHPSPPSVNYLFPPVRPFGYFTKKTPSTADDTQQGAWTPPPPPLPKKKRRSKKRKAPKLTDNSLDSYDKIPIDETYDEDDNSQMLNDTIQSMVSLNDVDETTLNTTINLHLNMNDSLATGVEDQAEQ